MHRSLVLIIIGCLFFSTSFAPSKYNEIEAPLSKEEKLFLTCKIWGFLKYYHPLVGKGSYDWDEKLLSVFNTTKNIQTHEEFSTFMTRWIYYMGDIGQCKSCDNQNREEHFLKNFDLSWTQSNKFSDELKKSLKNIEVNRFQGNHHYVGVGDLQQFEPKNELAHDDLLWQEENERLFVLFRFWNFIEYFYPYKYQTEQDWDDVLREMIPKFISADSREAFHLAMLELIVKVDDSHSGLVTSVLDEMPYYNYLPAKFEMVEGKAVITEIIDAEKSQQADLRVGDIISTINGQSASELHDSNKKYIWGSNDAVKDRSAFHTLFMGMKESPTVSIERNGTTKTTTLTLFKYSDIKYTKSDPKEKWRLLSDSIAYADLGQLSNGDIDPMMSELMDKSVIIFDVRNQPRGTYRSIAKYLNRSDTTFARYTKPDVSYPGKFVWQGQATCGSDNEDYYKGMVILLVNENTQDHAEFTCMCLQTAPNVVVIGSQTAGTDGKSSRIPMYSRFYTAMTGMGIFYGDQSETQRVGIKPDIESKPTIAGIRTGRDDVLEKAHEVANDEVKRIIAEERARQAYLDSLRMDSIRRVTLMDSTRMDSTTLPLMPLDSLSADSIKVDKDWDK